MEVKEPPLDLEPGGEVACGYRVPLSTYRLQLNADLTFRDALALVGYLHELGIGDCYASPVFAARPGSSHGYDVCDFSRVSPALGSQDEFDKWIAALQTRQMGLLLDMVPNHMAAHPSNTWWHDVLKNGPASPYADWFDINWQPRDATTPGGKVLLPILEDHYFKVLESGKLRIMHKDGHFVLTYQEHVLPLSPDSEALLEDEVFELCSQRERGKRKGAAEAGVRREILAVVRAGAAGASESLARSTSQASTLEDARSKARERLRRVMRELNGTVGRPGSFDRLHSLVQRQHYRLTSWRLSGEEINYRRFFDIGELVSLRMELPEVFEATHQFVLHLLRTQKVSGLRIDHPDGLWDPKGYFMRLQQKWRELENLSAVRPVSEERVPNAARQSLPNTPAGAGRLYLVAEKILSTNEKLPADWPIAGTTGYDFLNDLNGLFVNGANRDALEELYWQFTGDSVGFKAVVHSSKKRILRGSLRSDLRRLTHLLRAVAAQTRYGLDFGRSELETALVEVIAAFPVYRTYMTEESQAPAPQEREFILEAIHNAREHNQRLSSAVLEFIQGLLLLSPSGDLNPEGRQLARRFVLRLQQLTGPAMAKGLEDTAFYNDHRLISLNEVGGAPDVFGIDLNTFHQRNRERCECWPHSLLATATHDTKRGEDVRSRLNVLSEIPSEWRDAVTRWSRLNAASKTLSNGQPAPDSNDEYLLYQTLAGAWIPGSVTASGLEQFCQRISDYMLKAIREAKKHTSWSEPNSAYEDATRRFIERLLTPSTENPFLDDFMLFHRKVAFFGLFNSLAQVVIKATAPGVPDFYQGTELWDYSLVDPDNRRPVDFGLRQRLLSELREQLPHDPSETAGFLRGLLRSHHTGKIKLYLIWRVLSFRRSHRRLFGEGAYQALFAVGSKKDHVCAFARTSPAGTCITVAARLVVGLSGGAERAFLEPEVWQDTRLPLPGDAQPAGHYRNILTGQMFSPPDNREGLRLREVLELLPVAVLERVG